MPAARILIVDDEPVVLDALASCLTEDGYDVVGVGSGEQALALMTEQPFDLMILDVGLPDTSGFDVCRRLRALSDIPVIFLTASSALSERLSGFDLGADDYVTKPVAMSEMVRRVRAVLGRSEGRAPATVPLSGPNGITVSQRTHEVHVGGSSVAFTAKEFTLLSALLERRGEVLRADAIALAVWGHGTLGERNSLEAHISRVRAKLARAGAEDVIRTVRGVGYVVR